MPFFVVFVLLIIKNQGDIIILSTKEDVHYGIGRGLLNVENIPYIKMMYPSGRQQATERTMITDITKEILVMVICFDQANFFEIDKLLKRCLLNILRKYSKIPVIG